MKSHLGLCLMLLACSRGTSSADAGASGADAAVVDPYDCTPVSVDDLALVAQVPVPEAKPAMEEVALRDGVFRLVDSRAYMGGSGPPGFALQRRMSIRGTYFQRVTGFADGGVTVVAGNLNSVRPGYFLAEDSCPTDNVTEFQFSFADGGQLVLARGNLVDTYERVP